MVRSDQGDRLSLVADDVGGQDRLVGQLQAADVLAGDVGVGQHGVDPAGGQRLADRDRADLRVGMRAAQRDPPDHAVHPEVAAVGELPGHLRRPVGAAGA